MRWFQSAGLLGICVAATALPALGSDRSALVQVVNRAPVEESVTASPVSLNVGGTIELRTAIVGVRGGAVPTGSVVFSLTAPGGTSAAAASGPVALEPDGTASWSAPPRVGRYVASAAYSGDQEYQPNSGASQAPIVVLGPPDFSLDPPGSLTIKQGATGAFNVTIASINNFEGDVALSCSGLGSGMSCNFSPVSVKIAPLTGISSASSSLSISSTATTVETLSGSLLLIGLLRSWRRRRGWQIAFAVCLTVLAFASASLAGCGGSMRYEQKNGTPLGTYNVVITGTSGSLTHSETVVVTVN